MTTQATTYWINDSQPLKYGCYLTWKPGAVAGWSSPQAWAQYMAQRGYHQVDRDTYIKFSRKAAAQLRRNDPTRHRETQ